MAGETKGQNRSDGKKPSSTESIASLQRRVLRGNVEEDRVNVRLLINGSDDDGIRAYDEQISLSLLRALLNPEVADFYIPIAGTARTKPPRTRSHWLHTSAIREVLILDDIEVFPEEVE